METETLQALDNAPTPQRDEIGQRGMEVAPAMVEERVLGPATVTAGEGQQVEVRRRTLSNDYAPPSREGLEDRMETPLEQQPVRRQPGNEKSGRPIRDNVDLEGSTLEWSTGGKEEGRPAPRDGMQKTATATSSKRPKKLNIDREDDTPTERRRSRRRTTGITSL